MDSTHAQLKLKTIRRIHFVEHTEAIRRKQNKRLFFPIMVDFSQLWYKILSTFLFTPKQRINKSHPFSTSNLEIRHLIYSMCYIYRVVHWDYLTDLIDSKRYAISNVNCKWTLFCFMFACLKVRIEIHSISEEHQILKEHQGYQDKGRGALGLECRLPGSLSNIFSMRFHQHRLWIEPRTLPLFRAYRR